MSPGTMSTVDVSSRSSSEKAVMPTITASPVPRCTRCSTNVTCRLGGLSACTSHGDPLGPVTDDHDGALDIQADEGVQDVQDHRPTADDVEGFGSLGPHARALARRQDDR